MNAQAAMTNRKISNPAKTLESLMTSVELHAGIEPATHPYQGCVLPLAPKERGGAGGSCTHVLILMRDALEDCLSYSAVLVGT